MARHKSGLRKRLNGRWLRWKLARGLFRLLPSLAQRYSFPMVSAAAADTATQIIERGAVIESGGFSPSQIDEVVRPAFANDKIYAFRARIGESCFTREAAILSNCAVLGHVGTLIRKRDGAALYQYAGRPPNWNLAKPRRLKPRDMGDGLVTSLLGTQQYFHFFERLLPLLDYLDRHHPPGCPLTVLAPAKRPAFQQPIFDAIWAAYPGVQFVTLAPGERADIAHYLWLYHRADNSEWLPVTADAAQRLGALLRAHYGQPEPEGEELLFVSRGNAPLRRLENEAELSEMAVRGGFSRFEPGAVDHAEQISRFGNAKAIVAVHGAGLTNLLFARPGTKVVEIFPSNFIKTTYLWLSQRLGLEHRALIGSAGNYDQHFRLDPALFSDALDAFATPPTPRVRMKAPFLDVQAAFAGS